MFTRAVFESGETLPDDAIQNRLHVINGVWLALYNRRVAGGPAHFHQHENQLEKLIFGIALGQGTFG